MRWPVIPLSVLIYLNPHCWAISAFAADPQYELVVHVCLALNPTNCTSHTLQAHQLSANPSTAYREAMAIVAEWMEAHPGLVLKGFDLKPGRSS